MKTLHAGFVLLVVLAASAVSQAMSRSVDAEACSSLHRDLEVTVVDREGAALPGARVSLERLGGFIGGADSDVSGRARFLDLDWAGPYDIRTQVPGFDVSVVRVSDVPPGCPHRISVSLEVNTRNLICELLVTAGPEPAVAEAPVNLTVRVLSEEKPAATIPGAFVLIRNRKNRFRRETVTDVHGETRAALRPGSYDVEVSLGGFKTVKLKNVVVPSEGVLAKDVVLPVRVLVEVVE